MKEIYTFKFWKHKYGPELLIDIVDYAVMLPPIRRTLGKSAKEYIMDVVFEEACLRLRFTDTSVEEVSETLGFETSTYFIRSFGKRYGVTPLQYRKSSKE